MDCALCKINLFALTQRHKSMKTLCVSWLDANFCCFHQTKMKKNKTLLIEVDAAIIALRADGTFAKISNKWFATDITKK